MDLPVDDALTARRDPSQVRTTPPTLDDVASLLKLSPRTVSRVIRNEGGVSATTARRVRKAVQDLGYYPNLLASGLSGRRSGTVGIVGPNMSDPFFAELGDSLQRVAELHGRKTMYASSFGDAAQQQAILGSWRSYGVDGVILHPLFETRDAVETFAAQGTPTVVLDQMWSAPGLTFVAADRRGGARLAVDHLRSRGRSRLAMVNDGSARSADRLEGFADAVAGSNDLLVEDGEADFDGGRVAMTSLLERCGAIDGVFAYNDLMALGAVAAIKAAGKRVPDDVAVVGYDDIMVAAISDPALTTVRHDTEQVATEAIGLLELMVAPSESEPIPPGCLVSVTLVERQSS